MGGAAVTGPVRVAALEEAAQIALLHGDGLSGAELAEAIRALALKVPPLPPTQVLLAALQTLANPTDTDQPEDGDWFAWMRRTAAAALAVAQQGTLSQAETQRRWDARARMLLRELLAVPIDGETGFDIEKGRVRVVSDGLQKAAANPVGGGR